MSLLLLLQSAAAGESFTLAVDHGQPAIAGQSVTFDLDCAVTKADLQPTGSTVTFDLDVAVTQAEFSAVGQSITLNLTWSVGVTAAAIQPSGSAITFNLAALVGSAGIQPSGQAIPFDIGFVVAPAEFSLTGQDIDLSFTDFKIIEVESASLTVEGQTIEFIAPPAEASGGFFGFDRTLHLRKKRKAELEEQERQELADRLEAVMLAEGSITKPEADLIRLRGLVAQYSELPNKVNRAVLYAERARTEQALFLALREMQRLQEDEELAVLMAIALDD